MPSIECSFAPLETLTGQNARMRPMFNNDSLADEFEEDRSHLGAVAYRMLGSLSAAEYAVQESWLRVLALRGRNGRITDITLVAAPERLRRLEPAVPDQ
ncbi:MAG TPA: hypothetical protein VK636_13345 [Gemmatimonadaceae bacterium]|nr:hypothetical protein [Gemmatimonadaceae bacterium]